MTHAFTRSLRRPVALAATLACIMLAACGGGGGDDKPSSSPTSSAEPSASAPGGGSGTPGDSGNAGGGNNGGGNNGGGNNGGGNNGGGNNGGGNSGGGNNGGGNSGGGNSGGGNSGGGNNGGGNNGGGNNDGGFGVLTYGQLSACPASMKPLAINKLGCVQGYFDGKVFEAGVHDLHQEHETEHTCRLYIQFNGQHSGSTSFEWSYVNEYPVVSTNPLTLESKSEPDPSGDGIRFWESSLSTEEDNAKKRVSVLTSGTGQRSAGGVEFHGLVLQMVHDKAQKSIALEARETISGEAPISRSCRAVLR